MSEHHWDGEEPKPETFFGFIYEISNQANGMLYIGKKQFFKANPSHKVKTRPANRNGITWKDYHWVESDWRTYTGSSKDLNRDIKKYGKENFQFTILEQLDSRGTLHYAEVRHQVERDVLRVKTDDGEYLYYNKQIAAVRFRPPSCHSDETKAKIKESHVRNGHPMKGEIHPNRGKKLPQCAPNTAKPSTHMLITDGTINKYVLKDSIIEDGWRKGFKRAEFARTDSQEESCRKTIKTASKAWVQIMVDKTRYNTYEELCEYVWSSNKTRQELSKELGISWGTVDKITKRKLNE